MLSILCSKKRIKISDLKFENSIKNKGGGPNLGVPELFLRKIFKKLKISIFFEKKLYLKKEN